MPQLTKVVTIIAGEEEHDRIAEALAEIGVHFFTYFRVYGQGRHGLRSPALFDSANESFIVVTKEEIAVKILGWVEHQLIPNGRGVAYSTDAMAVLHPPRV